MKRVAQIILGVFVVYFFGALSGIGAYYIIVTDEGDPLAVTFYPVADGFIRKDWVESTPEGVAIDKCTLSIDAPCGTPVGGWTSATGNIPCGAAVYSDCDQLFVRRYATQLTSRYEISYLRFFLQKYARFNTACDASLRLVGVETNDLQFLPAAPFNVYGASDDAGFIDTSITSWTWNNNPFLDDVGNLDIEKLVFLGTIEPSADRTLTLDATNSEQLLPLINADHNGVLNIILVREDSEYFGESHLDRIWSRESWVHSADAVTSPSLTIVYDNACE